MISFETMSKQWLEFIVNCRRGVKHDYEIVKGAMVDDRIWDYIEDYIDSKITAAAFRELIKFKYPTHQIVFCSENALSALTFSGKLKTNGSKIMILKNGNFDITNIDTEFTDKVPMPTQIGKVYTRLILNTLKPNENYIDGIIRVYNDPICKVIDNYNSSAYYEPSYVIARAYNNGEFGMRFFIINFLYLGADSVACILTATQSFSGLDNSHSQNIIFI